MMALAHTHTHTRTHTQHTKHNPDPGLTLQLSVCSMQYFHVKLVALVCCEGSGTPDLPRHRDARYYAPIKAVMTNQSE